MSLYLALIPQVQCRILITYPIRHAEGNQLFTIPWSTPSTCTVLKTITRTKILDEIAVKATQFQGAAD